MPINYEFTGYIGKDVVLKEGIWTVLPNTLWTPPKGGAVLTCSVYVNCKYELEPSATRSGRLWVRVMRTSPNDGTMNSMLWLERGWGTLLDSRSFEKFWGTKDVGRNVRVEAMVEGVKSAYLNDTSYATYSQKW